MNAAFQRKALIGGLIAEYGRNALQIRRMGLSLPDYIDAGLRDEGLAITESERLAGERWQARFGDPLSAANPLVL
jgi:hypothetical protein